MGIHGDLTGGEIVEQALFAKALEPRLRNVVFMGMGEPLNNYAAVLAACACFFESRWLALGHGKVTVSTVGITHRVERLAFDEPRASLALSLHAPTQAKRVAIMPAARGHDLDRLLRALDGYVAAKIARSGDSDSATLLMVEYILLGGVNDTAQDADALADLLAPRAAPPRFGGRAMVNLIAYNETPGLPYARPTEATVRAFQAALVERGVLTCVRITMGADVAGACGQLLKETTTKTPEIEDAVPPPPPRRTRIDLRHHAAATPAAATAAPAAAPPRDATRAAVALALAAAGVACAGAAWRLRDPV
jgi:adenine C2-methylase RlmN of 23S rRNA A2503 and tRNA A37